MKKIFGMLLITLCFSLSLNANHQIEKNHSTVVLADYFCLQQALIIYEANLFTFGDRQRAIAAADGYYEDCVDDGY